MEILHTEKVGRVLKRERINKLIRYERDTTKPAAKFNCGVNFDIANYHISSGGDCATIAE